MDRKKPLSSVETEVLTQSKRWCALCYGLKGLREERRGQIAHVNHNPSDSRFANLVFLCTHHHDLYDSTTSQSKNYTAAEVRRYRDQIYRENESSRYSPSEITELRKYLRHYAGLFEYLLYEYRDIASGLRLDKLEAIGEIKNFWPTHPYRSFNAEIQRHQDEIARAIGDLRDIYEINVYNVVQTQIRFDTVNFSQDLLRAKENSAGDFIDEIADHYRKLRDIASSQP